MRQRVLASLGLPVDIGGHTLRAWPGFGALVGLDAAAWQAAGVDAWASCRPSCAASRRWARRS
jgi:hypothetical protein